VSCVYPTPEILGATIDAFAADNFSF
jgi:hypothetical protein